MSRCPDAVTFFNEEHVEIRRVENPDVVPKEHSVVRIMEENAEESSDFTKYYIKSVEYLVSDRIEAQCQVEKYE